MSIEFIGIAATAPHSETEIAAQQTDPVQPGYLEELALAHEEAGFDRVLLAHRPGFVAPTYAARKLATLDAFHPGRVALHVITGGDDADQARDGDLSDKVTRYRRTDEFLDVLRLEWTSAAPFDYDGEFYVVQGGLSGVRPPLGRIPVYFGGASADAIRVGGKHADVYAFWGEPLAGIQERIGQVRAAAAPYGRDPRFSVSLRPIPAPTETEAWQRAPVTAHRPVTGTSCPASPPHAARLRPPQLAALPELTAALAARAAEHDRDGAFPDGGIRLVYEAGLLTATVAGRYGGAGAGLAATVAILRALGRGDPSVALVTAMTLFTTLCRRMARPGRSGSTRTCWKNRRPARC